jgi:kynurenine formamidase
MIETITRSNSHLNEDVVVVDLTHTLSESTAVFPGKKPLARTICCYYESGYRIDDIVLGSGIGTHMDAPSHFFMDKHGVDRIPLSQCCGPACVIDLSHGVQLNADYCVSKNDIEDWENIHGRIPVESIVLIRTGWDKNWDTPLFCEVDEQGSAHFPGVRADGAQYLLDSKVKLVGIDTMGIDAGVTAEMDAHKILLGNNIVVVENLANLGVLPATGCTVSLLPMKIKDAPESPVRGLAYVPNSQVKV